MTAEHASDFGPITALGLLDSADLPVLAALKSEILESADFTPSGPKRRQHALFSGAGPTTYTFGRTALASTPDTPLLSSFSRWASSAFGTDGQVSTMALYGPFDDLTWHSDDERDFHEHFRIISFSIGGDATFYVQPDTSSRNQLPILIKSGDLIIFDGRVPHRVSAPVFTHPRVGDEDQKRLNVTIRRWKASAFSQHKVRGHPSNPPVTRELRAHKRRK